VTVSFHLTIYKLVVKTIKIGKIKSKYANLAALQLITHGIAVRHSTVKKIKILVIECTTGHTLDNYPS